LRYCWEKKSFYRKLRLDFANGESGVFVDVDPMNSYKYNRYFEQLLKIICRANAATNEGGENYSMLLKRHYQELRKELQREAVETDEAAELLIPQPYNLCSCCSGKKFKFCCAPIFPEIMEAMCAVQDFQYDVALKWMEEAEKKVGNTAEVLCRKAIIYDCIDKKLYHQHLKKCLQVNPNHARAHYLQELEFRKMRDYEKAVEAYLTAIKHYPPTDHYHLNEVYNNLANVYYELGEQRKAISAWEMAIEHSPTDIMALNNLETFGSKPR
jgi:tetratricopeptide (TPR) repeat protein